MKKLFLSLLIFLCFAALGVMCLVDLRPYLQDDQTNGPQIQAYTPADQEDASLLSDTTDPPNAPLVPDTRTATETTAAPDLASNPPAPHNDNGAEPNQTPDAATIVPQAPQVPQPEAVVEETTKQSTQATIATSEADEEQQLEKSGEQVNKPDAAPKAEVEVTSAAPTTFPSLDSLPEESIEAVTMPDDFVEESLKSGAYPYSILLGTFSKAQTAQDAVPLFRKQRLTPYWVEVDLGSQGIFYRLFTGFFRNEQDAAAYKKKHNIGNKPTKKTSYGSLLGQFSDRGQLYQAYETARKAGISPYVLSSAAGKNGTGSAKSSLYGGTFYTMQGAKDQCSTLKSSFPSCKAVSRAVR